MLIRSLSARRAWIEISPAGCWRDARRVALRKESVDRNILSITLLIMSMMSLSARRAWIEILSDTSDVTAKTGRSPQGERG